MIVALIASGLMAAAGPGVAQAPVAVAPAATLPGWLTGCWVEEKGAGADARWTEECWTVPRAGMMLGSGRSGDATRTRSWETMQIVRDDKAADGTPVQLAFWGAPKGANRTLFRWRADGAPGVSFYNESHDYPQRIRYWRDGEFLMAETALADGSKAMRWRYRRM